MIAANSDFEIMKLMSCHYFQKIQTTTKNSLVKSDHKSPSTCITVAQFNHIYFRIFNDKIN